MAEAGLHRTIPALPVRSVGDAVAFYRDRFGSMTATDFGTREFATLGLDGNLLSFFRWEQEIGDLPASSVSKLSIGLASGAGTDTLPAPCAPA